jgi:hypothetical protein
MTDTVTTDDFFAKYQAERQQELERLAKVQPEYLRAIASYGITSADVEFDGYGDEGQIVDIAAEGITDPLDKVPLRPGHERFFTTILGSKEKEKTVYDLIEEFTYEMLDRSEYGGWEINGGSFGTLHVEPAKGIVKIDMNLRIMESENHSIDMSIELKEENA